MEQEIDIGAVEARILEATGVLQEELAASNQSIADLAEQGRYTLIKCRHRVTAHMKNQGNMLASAFTALTGHWKRACH